MAHAACVASQQRPPKSCGFSLAEKMIQLHPGVPSAFIHHVQQCLAIYWSSVVWWSFARVCRQCRRNAHGRLDDCVLAGQFADSCFGNNGCVGYSVLHLLYTLTSLVCTHTTAEAKKSSLVVVVAAGITLQARIFHIHKFWFSASWSAWFNIHHSFVTRPKKGRAGGFCL